MVNTGSPSLSNEQESCNSKNNGENEEEEDKVQVGLPTKPPSFFCSLPLDKVQTVLQNTPNIAAATSKVKNLRKLMCLFCDRTFVSEALRLKHVERCHSPKQFRRVSLRKQQQQSAPANSSPTTNKTPFCCYCDKLAAPTLDELFQHLITAHSSKYFACAVCKERFFNKQQLVDHNLSVHNKATHDVPEEDNDERKKQRKAKNLKKFKQSKAIVKRSKRLQAKVVVEPQDKPKLKKVKTIQEENRKDQDSNKSQSLPKLSSSINPYPEFDNYFQVKRITDHSIDNLKISSLTFDDVVFDKAFFTRIRCNIQENLLNHIDGKLFKNEESETRISNFENKQPPAVASNSEAGGVPSSQLDNNNYGCEISLNAVTPTTSLLSTQQFGEDPESQIEYASKPNNPTASSSNKKKFAQKDQIHYKYFTRRKYQSIIQEQKENRDLSKLDMWTQLIVKDRQQKVADGKKTAEEILDYFSGEEYRTKMRQDELNRILDRRGPFEDLRAAEKHIKKCDKSYQPEENEEILSEVGDLMNEILNNVFTVVENNEQQRLIEIPSYLNLRPNSNQDDLIPLDKSDKIALICSSQETENFEEHKPLTTYKNQRVELSGEWARSRICVCAACGLKLQNIKQFLEHKANAHQYVWVQHYEFVGMQSDLYPNLNIPVLGNVGLLEENPAYKLWKRSEARLCTKCSKQCNSLGELHRHILECGGDWTWMLVRKKCKYRPFGAKSRKKRRGLVKRLSDKQQKSEEASGEEKKTKMLKKRVEGPRQKPSDAETIQRMLANLPPKRATRKLISLKDGFSNRKNKQQQQQQVGKLKCGKQIHEKKQVQQEISKNVEQTSATTSKLNRRRSLRSLNKVITPNSTLIVKRKYKNKVVNDNSVKKQTTTQNDKANVVTLRKTRGKNGRVKSEEEITTTEKRSSPRITDNKKMKDLVGPAENKMNIKRFFPVKKKKVESNEIKKVKNENQNVRKRRAATPLEETLAKIEETKLDEEEKKEIIEKAEEKSRSQKIRNKFRNVVNKIKKMKVFEKKKKGKEEKEAKSSEENLKDCNNWAESDEKPVNKVKEEINKEESIKFDEGIKSPTAIKPEPKRIRRPTRGLNDCIAMLTNKLTNQNTPQDLTITNNETSEDLILKVPFSNEHFCLKQQTAQAEVVEEKKVDEIKITEENQKATIEGVAKINVEEDENKAELSEKQQMKQNNGELKLSQINKISTTVRKKRKKKKIVSNNKQIDEYFAEKKSLIAISVENHKDLVLINNKIETDDEEELPLAKIIKIRESKNEIVVEEVMKENAKIDEEKKEVETELIQLPSQKDANIPLKCGGNIDELVPSPKTADKCVNIEETAAEESKIVEEVQQMEEVNEIKENFDQNKKIPANNNNKLKSSEKNLLVELTNNQNINENKANEEQQPDVNSKSPKPSKMRAGRKLQQQNEENNKDESVNNNNNGGMKELRRSCRNSKKIIYNEIDLVDPLIDELDSKMAKEIESIQLPELVKNCVIMKSDYHHQAKSSLATESAKLNSDELFDMLKSTPIPSEKKNVPKLPIETSEKLSEAIENDVEIDTKSSSDMEEDLSIAERSSIIITTPITIISETPKKVVKKKKNKKQIEATSLKVMSSDVKKANYCEICNKSFCRLEGLMKHKRTLTHISKLSELEAKEQQTKLIVEAKENSELIVAERDEIVEKSVLPTFSLTVDNNACLKLADIINDVLNKPTDELLIENNEEIMVENNFSNSPNRCRSLGERKSFEEESATTPPPLITTKEYNFEERHQEITSTAQKQISLLENIIENRLDCLNEDNFEDEDETTTHDEDNTLFQTRVKESNFHQDAKINRKVLNRDEELFLECCSLLKSGSEVSNFSKKSSTNKEIEKFYKNEEQLNNVDERKDDFWDNFDATNEKSSSYDDCSTTTMDSKKIMLTKGALKVFEGLKVSIPTEELNLNELLISSPKAKLKEIKKIGAVAKNQEEKSELFTSPSTKSLHQDIYDFEETQDNSDIFINNSKSFRYHRGSSEMKKMESDCDSDYLDTLSSSSSLPDRKLAKSAPTAKTNLSSSKQQENTMTKKKCMIMGRIFKNAMVKAKIEDDECIRNIPIVDNTKLVEDFVLSCSLPEKSPPTPPPVKAMTEEEMNLAFDKLIGNVATNKQQQQVKKSLPSLKRKNSQAKSGASTKKKRAVEDSDRSDDEFELKKAPKKRTKRGKSVKAEDNCINLEQELRECIGVAGRKSQRKCTSGKQNVLIEYWSSDESLSAAEPAQKKEESPNEQGVVKEMCEMKENETLKEVKEKLMNSMETGPIFKKKNEIKSTSSSSSSLSGRRKRTAANPLYHWSSSSDEDETNDLIEVKPLRDDELDNYDEDDDERPIQHGWIVGDSHKKLVKMLAQAKGKKCGADEGVVKEQSTTSAGGSTGGKKRTNALLSSSLSNNNAATTLFS